MSSDSQITISTNVTQPPGADIFRSKNWPWYKSPTELHLNAVVRQIFEGYNHIPSAEIESHILHIRDVAWEIFPWPCFGEFWFVSFGLARHPKYSSLVSRLSGPVEDGSTPLQLLDLGTCMGQDLGKLHYDGVALEATKGTWDVIVIVMLLHVFDWNDQMRAAERILDLLSLKSGSMIIGAQTATTKPGKQVLSPPFVQPGKGKIVYRQGRETFVQMWKEIEQAKGVNLNIWAEYEDEALEGPEGIQERKFFTGAEQRRLYFTIERV